MIFLSIDLQSGFSPPANNPRIIKAAQEEVERAIRYNYGIIFLEYNRHGQTISDIKSLTKNYKKVTTVAKDSDDGGINVLDSAFYNNFKTDCIRICGVYTEFCVMDTVNSLTRLSPTSKILLRKDGCACWHKKSEEKYYLKKLKGLSDKVELI